MNTAEILQAKDLRIQVLEEQLTACKSDRKRLKKQLKLYRVIFCLPLNSQTFEEWVNANFNIVNKHYFECKKQATVNYNHTEIMEIYGFLTDRITAN